MKFVDKGPPPKKYIYIDEKIIYMMWKKFWHMPYGSIELLLIIQSKEDHPTQNLKKKVCDLFGEFPVFSSHILWRKMPRRSYWI